MDLHNKKCLVSFLLALLAGISLVTPNKIFACDTSLPSRLRGSCQPAQCGAQNTWEGYIEYSADNFQTMCIQLEYFSDPECRNKTPNPCPARCSVAGIGSPECGAGICANGNLSATQICGGNYGNDPKWCVGAVCGYDCEVSESTYSCPAAARGTVVPIADYDRNTDDNLSSTDCNAWCNQVAVSLSASPSNIATNSSSTLTWTAAYARSCTASGVWSGSKSTSNGSESTGNLSPAGSYAYTLQCTNNVTGASASSSTTINAINDDCNGSQVSGNTTTTWQCYAGSSCPSGWSSTTSRQCGGRAGEICCSQSSTPPTLTLTPTPTTPTPTLEPEITITPIPIGTPNCSITSFSLASGSSNATFSVSGANLDETGRNRYSFSFRDSSNALVRSEASVIPPENQSLTMNAGTGSVKLQVDAWDSRGQATTISCGERTWGAATATPTLAPGITPTPTVRQGPLTCRKCGAQGDRWLWTANCSRWGPQDQNCSADCPLRTDPNVTPPREDGYCWLNQTPPPEPSGTSLGGNFLIQREDGSTYNMPNGEARTVIYVAYGDPYCYNGCKDRIGSGMQYLVNGLTATLEDNGQALGLIYWPEQYELVGYIKHQRKTCAWGEVSSDGGASYQCRTLSSRPGWIYDCNNGDPLDRPVQEQNLYSQSVSLGSITMTMMRAGGWLTTAGNPTNAFTCTDFSGHHLGNTGPTLDFIFRKNSVSISGNVFTDYLCNGVKDSEDTNYPGGRIFRSGSSTPAITDSSGNYTLTDLQKNQNYTITPEVPVGYRITTQTPITNPHTVNNITADVTNVNFGLCPVASAWFQNKDADVYAAGTLTSKIPIACATFPSQCTPKFSLPGLGSYPGVPVAGSSTAPNFGSGTVSDKGWIAPNSLYRGRRYDYNYFVTRAPTEYVINIQNDTIDAARFFHSGITDANGYRWFKREGNLTITSFPQSLQTQKVVLFINGSLTINQPIMVNPGGFFAAFVSGNITINPSSVSYFGSPPPGISVAALQGIYFANGTISTGTQAGPTSQDPALYIRGVLATAPPSTPGGTDGGSVNLQRNLDNPTSASQNATRPAEYVEYAPDLILQFPARLLNEYKWEEVAP